MFLSRIGGRASKSVFRSLFPVFLLWIALSDILSAQNYKFISENEVKINARAEEIKYFLSTTPRCVGRPISDRKAWNVLAEETGFRNIVKSAGDIVQTPVPELPESLYKEYFDNGNRSRYQNERNKKYGQVRILVLAECLENNGRFIAPLEDTIRSICADPSWVLPAHDSEAGIYDGKHNYIDLASSDTSAELGMTDYWLGDKLSPEIRAMIRENVHRRTFSSYKETLGGNRTASRGNWWITTTNNWNAVCHANVVCAAQCLIDDPGERAWYIAAAEIFMKPFFSGFTPDGYCSEGMGYWNYGFGHFVQLAEIVWQATGGKVDFLTMPPVHNCALFGPRMEIAPGIYAAFADCSISAKPSVQLVQFLSLRLGLGLAEYEKLSLMSAGQLQSTGVYCFPNSATQTPAGGELPPPGKELRTEFSDAGVLICRPKPGTMNSLSMVCKGGHNAEHHNHNDVGSFTVVYEGTQPLLDPGGEIYTRRTFSNRRYESTLLNSYGHPVPVINGKLQQTGRKSGGRVVSKSFSDDKDVLIIDYASAYPAREIKKLERCFEYFRGGSSSLTITDEIELSPAGTVETALVTYEPWEKNNDEAENGTSVLFIGQKGKRIRILVTATVAGTPAAIEFSTSPIDEDAMSRKKPTRFSFKIKQPIENAKITTVITPEE